MTTLIAKENTETQRVARLVRAAQEGSRRAFGRLVERYERAVYLVALRRLGHHAEAQELTQEVFIQALRKIHQLREPERFGGWIRAITARMAINRAVRRQPESPRASEVFEGLCVERGTPLSAMLRRERETQLQAGLKRLADLDRETLVAFYFDGRSLIEMSERFASPVGTIKRRLHVARKRLARELAGIEED
ncbi:MAG: RNA polymerase sigma factor [Planctomycetota bacterium]